MVWRFSAKKEIYFPTKILKPEGRSWYEHFPPPSLQKSILKTVQWNVIIIIIYILYDYYHCCSCCRWWYLLSGLHVLRTYISSLLQSATAYFIIKCDRLFITKFDKCYYKVRHVKQIATIVFQSATCELAFCWVASLLPVP